MTIKKIFLAALLFASTQNILAWGNTGHRVVGEVAAKNIKKKTARKIAKLLQHETLASASTFGDDIKSDKRFDAFNDWHYEDFEFGKKHEESNYHDGQLVKGIDFCIQKIKDKNASKEDKVFYLKFLLHLVGDLHQPLHVGDKNDKGGNDIKLQWFGKPTNLHRVWDEDMINQYGMSYTELSNNLPYKTKQEKKIIISGTVMDWMYESQKIAFTQIYPSVKPDEKLFYKYNYDYFEITKNQLEKAGLRLAKILDEIFS